MISATGKEIRFARSAVAAIEKQAGAEFCPGFDFVRRGGGGQAEHRGALQIHRHHAPQGRRVYCRIVNLQGAALTLAFEPSGHGIRRLDDGNFVEGRGKLRKPVALADDQAKKRDRLLAERQCAE